MNFAESPTNIVFLGNKKAKSKNLYKKDLKKAKGWRR